MSEPAAVQDADMAIVEAAGEARPPIPSPGLNGQTSNGYAAQQDIADHEDSDDDGAAGGDGADGQAAASSKKAKSKKKKKKSSTAKKAATSTSTPAMKQTDPPSIGLSKIYTNGQYPIGEVCEYKDE